ncbi:lysocardiolipin acyltransferase 1-like isoform X2 [Achroia grisella]|uniref:lysocardiolipin acyltransferase 1-like isoform X2 n=1 Tax=Achroia grisella TaxID=688607 RepID=UPI0027D28299|nr:lysocardiolipin acyltransferase 1-like isoform X2 [Achroia grisella]
MAAGLFLCIIWYYTIIAGFYILYCPVMYIIFFNHKLYRNLVDVLFALWELYPVALFQCVFGSQLHLYGDYVNPDENSIIILNHRTRVDWNYVWIALYHAAQDTTGDEDCICKLKSTRKFTNRNFLDWLSRGKARLKFVLKDEIKIIPGLGWIMQLNFFLYVKRDWRKDQLNLCQFIDYYKKLHSECRLVLFPEGTDLSEDNKRRSNKFAEANNLPYYNFVLHPRTTGWIALCTQLRSSGLASVYDVTIAYDKPAQTEADILRGEVPKHVYFYFKRYNINNLPEDEEALKRWLNDRWREKEENLSQFYRDGKFKEPTSNKTLQQRKLRSMRFAKIGFLFWTVVDIIFLYAIYNSVIFQFWLIYHTFLFIFVTWYFGGFQHIQYKLLEKRNM